VVARSVESRVEEEVAGDADAVPEDGTESPVSGPDDTIDGNGPAETGDTGAGGSGESEG
jgi:hypothetical protein